MTGAGLYQPSREAFAALAAEHAVVPVWREVLADLQTPLAVYDRLRSVGGPTFLLESVEHGERWGRWSFIGLRPFLELSACGGRVTLAGDAPRDAAAVAA
ncbi:MAG: anthranilate synthase component I, partial [Actinomycetota bacterium]|nr:anthranilate synthase component I [Actinomycetota bacterium]